MDCRKCQFTDSKTKLQKFDVFSGEFEEVGTELTLLASFCCFQRNGTWICVKYGREIKTEIKECSEEEDGTITLKVYGH